MRARACARSVQAVRLARRPDSLIEAIKDPERWNFHRHGATPMMLDRLNDHCRSLLSLPSCLEFLSGQECHAWLKIIAEGA